MDVRRLFDPVISIEDDRGERRPFDLPKRPELQTQREARKELREKTRLHLHTPVDRMILAGLLLIMFVSVLGTLASTLALWIRLPLSLGLVWGFSYLAARWRSITGRDRVVAVYKLHRLCPCCGFDLHSVSPGRDHLTTCPECGAAWRMDGGSAPEDRT